jgi:hypothetical protein
LDDIFEHTDEVDTGRVPLAGAVSDAYSTGVTFVQIGNAIKELATAMKKGS